MDTSVKNNKGYEMQNQQKLIYEDDILSLVEKIKNVEKITKNYHLEDGDLYIYFSDESNQDVAKAIIELNFQEVL